MNELTFIIVYVISAVVWGIICRLLYQRMRNASWQAGWTVSCLLFLLGLTVGACFRVPETIFLAPLWMGLLALSILHVRAAEAHAEGMEQKQYDPGPESMVAAVTPLSAPEEEAGFFI